MSLSMKSRIQGKAAESPSDFLNQTHRRDCRSPVIGFHVMPIPVEYRIGLAVWSEWSGDERRTTSYVKKGRSLLNGVELVCRERHRNARSKVFQGKRKT